MELDHWRYNGGRDATLGILFERIPGPAGQTRRMLCFLCEDEYRESKVRAETRIPAGRYRILLRMEGGMSARYAFTYGQMHVGMLWLQDVPNFTYCYYHVGNDDDDTEGCPLVGLRASESTRSIEQSRAAYRAIYPRISQAILSGEQVWVNVVDLDRPTLPTPVG